MSYKCEVCNVPQPHGQKLKRWVVKRVNGQIEKEIPVCPDCNAGLKSGYSIDEVRRLVGCRPVRVPDALTHLPTVCANGTAPPAKPVHIGKK